MSKFQAGGHYQGGVIALQARQIGTSDASARHSDQVLFSYCADGPTWPRLFKKLDLYRLPSHFAETIHTGRTPFALLYVELYPLDCGNCQGYVVIQCCTEGKRICVRGLSGVALRGLAPKRDFCKRHGADKTSREAQPQGDEPVANSLAVYLLLSIVAVCLLLLK